jgi:hypothetical protein
MFKNRVLRRIFGPKRDELMGCCRKLHIEDLHNVYSSPDIRMNNELGRACSMHGSKECIQSFDKKT